MGHLDHECCADCQYRFNHPSCFFGDALDKSITKDTLVHIAMSGKVTTSNEVLNYGCVDSSRQVQTISGMTRTVFTVKIQTIKAIRGELQRAYPKKDYGFAPAIFDGEAKTMRIIEPDHVKINEQLREIHIVRNLPLPGLPV